MKLPYKLFLIVLLLVSAHGKCIGKKIVHTKKATTPKNELVWYPHMLCADTNRWLWVTASDGFMCYDQHSGKKIRETNLVITVNARGKLRVNNHVISRTIHIFPVNNALVINGVSCRGSLCVSPQKIVLYTDGNNKNIPATYVWPALYAQCSKEALQQPRHEIQSIERTFAVRILLACGADETVWRLHMENGYAIYDAEQYTYIGGSHGSHLIIERLNGRLYINDTPYAQQQLFISALADGNGTFEGKTYEGSFIVCNTTNQIYLINCLGLEDYVYSVLRTESWPGWPLEVNKVFAIACRSYAIAMVMNAQKMGYPYHMTNTNAHQTYTGKHSSTQIRQAVDETKHTFLAYNRMPIIAMFDGCCGGIIPAHIAGFNFARAPYLAREYACTYCKRCKLYSWRVACDIHTFEQYMGVKRLRDIKVTKKDKAGLVHQVFLKGRPATTVSGKKIYAAVPGVKSFCFDVHKKSGMVTLTGRGYGHHIGLCQWGAREMVRDGWDYRRILQFYYPGTQFMRLI